MPQIASAKKRVRVTARQTEENRLHRTRARTAIKRVRSLLAAGKKSEAVAAVATAQAYLDKAAKVRAFHPNTVSRYKSRLAAALKAAGNTTALPGRTAPSPKPAAKKSGKKASAKQTSKKSATKKAPATQPARKPAAKKAPTKKTT